MPALENTNMPKLKLVAKGKVRDIYALPDDADSDKLLFVATDRISAFDIIMENVSICGQVFYTRPPEDADAMDMEQGIPNKGSLLTTLSLFWFDKLSKILPHHVLAPAPSTCWNEDGDQTKADAAWQSFPRSLDEYRDQLEGRSMIVRKCEVIKVEAIVRGYITGQSVSTRSSSQIEDSMQ